MLVYLLLVMIVQPLATAGTLFPIEKARVEVFAAADLCEIRRTTLLTRSYPDVDPTQEQLTHERDDSLVSNCVAVSLASLLNSTRPR
jgi:hypothetical protein